ncbi:AI-2E family transporter [Falsiroseomonas sp.]|uniref:AI-2E family transporter n=1 Tax=Falsiroseomonas sp. TaxID=2870721 RepID=UPI002735B7A4|nr:AI-2E family transporter [Falsiroseomonas sp.]MDP3416186.1 AI-2E family transporter [Falsiroseomonas sp.]
MVSDRAMRTMIGLCTVILIAAALRAADTVFAPIAVALFVIALVRPVQRGIQPRAGAAIAALATMLLALVAVAALAVLSAWAFGRVGQWTIVNAAALQALYVQKLALLQDAGIPAEAMAGLFDMRLMVRLAQQVTAQLQGVLSFTVVTLVFVILGLLEVDVARRQLEALRDSPAAAALLRAASRTAAKLRAYMAVRTAMSILTGLAVWAFARAMGLELAEEWGLIAFVLNYIPFIGPLVATVFPTAFAALQFGTWQVAVTVFAALQVIQFLSGSYIEPRVAGRRLAVSPFLVLVAVFLGAFLWGIIGAFIGVPILIAILCICDEFEQSRWAARLFSGLDAEPVMRRDSGGTGSA